MKLLVSGIPRSGSTLLANAVDAYCKIKVVGALKWSENSVNPLQKGSGTANEKNH